MGAVRAHHGHSDFAVDDARTSRGYVDPVDRVVDHWDGFVLRIRAVSQPGAVDGFGSGAEDAEGNGGLKGLGLNPFFFLRLSGPEGPLFHGRASGRYRSSHGFKYAIEKQILRDARKDKLVKSDKVVRMTMQ